MSRYTITVTGGVRADPDAVIGYDPPLRTFFLQAFPDESGDDLALWLGTSDREYKTLDALHAAARSRGSTSGFPITTSSRGYPLTSRRKLTGRRIDGPLAALLRHLQSKEP